MGAGFLALFVATDGFGSGAYSGKPYWQRPAYLSAGREPETTPYTPPYTTTKPVYTGARRKLDHTPTQGMHTHLMDCYAIAPDGSKWKVSQGVFLETDRE